MAFNDSYAEQAEGFSGQLSDIGMPKRVESYVQGEASASIPFGVVVVQGTEGADGSADKAILPVDANSVPVGIVLHSHTYDPRRQLDTTGILIKEMMSVLKKGRCRVYVEGTVVKGAYLYARYTASGGNTQKGALRADGDTSKALACRGIIAAESITGAGIIQVDVDIDAGNSVVGLT